MIGEWIEVNDRIYEVLSETETDFLCREVLYKDFTYKLNYGDVVAVSKKEAWI